MPRLAYVTLNFKTCQTALVAGAFSFSCCHSCLRGRVHWVHALLPPHEAPPHAPRASRRLWRRSYATVAWYKPVCAHTKFLYLINISVTIFYYNYYLYLFTFAILFFIFPTSLKCFATSCALFTYWEIWLCHCRQIVDQLWSSSKYM